MKTDAAWALTAYAAAVIAAPATAISDVQALVYGVGSGIAGGVLAGLMANKPSGREYAVRIIACGLGAPSLVWFGYLKGLDTLTLYPVVAASGLAGLLAWPALSLLRKAIEKSSPSELKQWVRQLIASMLGVKLPKDGDQ